MDTRSDTTEASPCAPGTMLAQKYRLGRVLGEGGMARVYEAVHTGLGTRVAVKLLHREWAQDAEIVARFSREAKAAARLESPHIARVLDVDVADDTGQPFLTMELLVGEDLAATLAREGTLPYAVAADYVVQAAKGIRVAHAAGIVHRDLKPENLFVTDLGHAASGRGLVKILDFGIAKDKRAEASRQTQPGAVFGTVFYMAPEQIRSSDSADARTDIWALGAILYELLAGAPPFHGDAHSVIAQIVADPVPPLRALRPDVPAALEAIVMRALEYDPAKRIQTAEELARALEAWAPPESIQALVARLPPDSIPRVLATESLPPANSAASRAATKSWESLPGHAPSSSRKRLLAGVVAAVVVLGIIVAVALSRSNDAPATAATPPPPPPSIPSVEAPPVVATSATPEATTQAAPQPPKSSSHAGPKRPPTKPASGRSGNLPDRL